MDKLDFTVRTSGEYARIDGYSKGIEFRERQWLVRVNPKWVPVGLRRKFRQHILVDGQKRGWCEYRFGCLPLDYVKIGDVNIWRKIINSVRRFFGIGMSEGKLGYFKVKLGRYAYVIRQSYTEKEVINCYIYAEKTGEPLGMFAIYDKFTKVNVSFGNQHLTDTIIVLISVVVDYWGKRLLEREIKIDMEIKIMP